MDENGTVISFTRNVKFAAYLRFRGHHPKHIQKLTKGKAVYGFDIQPGAWEVYKSEFDVSHYLTYAQCLDAIIDLAY